MVTRKKKKPEPVKSGNSSWVGLLLVISLAGNGWQYTHRNPAPAPGPDQTIVDNGETKPGPKPPAPKPDAINLKECVLVTIADKKTVNEDVDYLLTMQDDAFWDEMAGKLADVEHMEDDDDPAKRWLESAKLTAPVVMLVNQKTKKVLWSMPLPKGGTADIRKKLGG